MKKFLNFFNKPIAFILVLSMIVSLFSSYTLRGFAEGKEGTATESTVEESIESSETVIGTEMSEESVGDEENIECICESFNGVHQEGCNLYVESFDVDAAKDYILGLKTAEEVEEYMASLSQEEGEVLLEILTEAEIRALANELGVNLNEEITTPAINFTEVGALMPPVKLTSPIRFFSMSREAETENGLLLNKTSVSDGNGGYTITMEAYTTGTVTSSETAVPTDIVLVLDESGSMTDRMYQYEKTYDISSNNTYYVKQGDSYITVNWCTGGLFNTHDDGWYSGGHFFIHWGTRYEPMTSATDTTEGHVQFYTRSETAISKSEALMNAATDFVNDVYKEAVDNNVDHRVAVIGFSSNGNASTKIGLVDDIRENIGTKDTSGTVLYAVNHLNANGGTYIEDGMTLAKSAFDNAAVSTVTTRNRIVVVFTDGIPGSGDWESSTITNSANPAIAASYDLKNDYGATIYSIGMLDDANPELEISDETNDAARTNKFLHYLSSNYPNAKSMSDGGSGSNQGYYLSASDTASLDAIFKKISENISTPTISLGSNTVVKDVVAQYFTVPENTSDIKIFTADYNGSTFGNREIATGVTATITGDTVSVTGFDYNANFISNTAKSDGTFGKKLIIEFTVTPKEGFLGGNNVPTNGPTSGVYDSDGNLVENFVVPTVNVPIPDISVIAADKNVYLLGALNEADLMVGASAEAADNNLFGDIGWQDDYVTITKDIIESSYSALVEDTTYTVSVTLTPKEDGTDANGDVVAAKTKTSDPAKIYVFKPVLTFRDGSVYYGAEEPVYDTENKVRVVWENAATNKAAADVTMIGDEPTLILTYTPDAGAVDVGRVVTAKDYHVNVTVEIGDVDITNNHVTFAHETCGTANCGFDSSKGEFMIHILSLPLTINKTFATGTTPQVGETFIFTVKGTDAATSSVDMTVTLVAKADGTVAPITINNLPIGTYTVTEDMTWSWRYEVVDLVENKYVPSTSDKNVHLGDTQSVTFINKNKNNQWIDSNAYCENTFAVAGSDTGAKSSKVDKEVK